MNEDEIKRRAAMVNNSTVVCVQNKDTGVMIEAYKLVDKHLMDMDTLDKLGPEWIEQPRYMSTMALMMYICAAGLALFVAVSFLGK